SVLAPGDLREGGRAAQPDDGKLLAARRDGPGDELALPRPGGEQPARIEREHPCGGARPPQPFTTRHHAIAPFVELRPRARPCCIRPSHTPSSIHTAASGTATDASAARPMPSRPSRPSAWAPTTSPVRYTKVSMNAFALYRSVRGTTVKSFSREGRMMPRCTA